MLEVAVLKCAVDDDNLRAEAGSRNCISRSLDVDGNRFDTHAADVMSLHESDQMRCVPASSVQHPVARREVFTRLR